MLFPLVTTQMRPRICLRYVLQSVSDTVTTCTPQLDFMTGEEFLNDHRLFRLPYPNLIANILLVTNMILK